MNAETTTTVTCLKKRLSFGGRCVSASFRGRSIPQWLADWLVKEAQTESGVSKYTLERKIRKAYPLGQTHAIYALATALLRYGKASKAIVFDGQVWRYSTS